MSAHRRGRRNSARWHHAARSSASAANPPSMTRAASAASSGDEHGIMGRSLLGLGGEAAAAVERRPHPTPCYGTFRTSPEVRGAVAPPARAPRLGCAHAHRPLPRQILDYSSKLATKKHTQRAPAGRRRTARRPARRDDARRDRPPHGISDDLAGLNANASAVRGAVRARPRAPRGARVRRRRLHGHAAKSFGERDFTEAQKTVRILSGLYGLLRPLDLIAPYRLEMGTKLDTPAGQGALRLLERARHPAARR